MDVVVSLPESVKGASLLITGSKSETNRLLLLRALYPDINIHNASDSDDSRIMRKALAVSDAVVDVHHAGTAMRFLTAYFALQEGRQVTLTGSQRMKERPIGILVDALRNLGAKIDFLEKDGYPPLKITGQKLGGGSVSIDAGVSSQYITALLLIAPRMEQGLELVLKGEITSRPYIEMTLGLLREAGITISFRDNVISVAPYSEIPSLKSEITVESDWSSASYFYSIVALADAGTTITLSSYKQNSLQGDSALAEIFKEFGVKTKFSSNSIILTKVNCQPSTVNYQLNNTPDIAQTIAVTCLGMRVGCRLTGLHTLKIKETDRLMALKSEMEKFGAKVTVTDDALELQPPGEHLASGVTVETYNDHRMAMAFAPLAVKTRVIIKEAEVVSKSYPGFWDDLKHIGFEVKSL